MKPNRKLFPFLLPPAALLLLWTWPEAEPTSPSAPAGTGRTGAVHAPAAGLPAAASREAVGRTVYDLRPGEVLELACTLHSKTTIRQRDDAPAQQVELTLDCVLRLAARARRGQEWIAELALVEPRVTLAAGGQPGDGTRLAGDLRLPWLVRFGAAGELRGYRFAEQTLAEHRNVARSLFSALRAPVAASGAWRGCEGDAAGIAELSSAQHETGIRWQRHGYPARADGRPVPAIEGRGSARAGADACWWSATDYTESQRLQIPQAGVEIDGSVHVTSTLLRISAREATDAGELWDGPWQPATGAAVVDGSAAVSEAGRWERELRGVALHDLVGELGRLVAAGEAATAEAFAARERLCWLLRLHPALAIELGATLREPCLGAPLAAQLAGALGAAATPQAQQMLLELAQSPQLPRGRRNGALVALVQVERPLPEITAALRGLAERSDGDRTLRGTSLLLLGAQASRAGAAPAQRAHLLAFESAAQRDDLLVSWLGALGNAGGDGVLAPAQRHLRDEREEVRAAALGALRTHAGGQATDLLLQAAGTDPEPAVRAKAIELLGGRTDPRVLAALERAFGDQDEQVRRSAVLAGSRRSEPVVQQWLLRAAGDDPSPHVRRAAAELLGDQRAGRR